MPIQDQTYRLAEPHVTAEEFDGEYVVLNLESGEYFSFAGPAALVWQGLIEGFSPNQLTSSLDAAGERANEVRKFIQQIIDAGLVAIGEPAGRLLTKDLPQQISESSGELVLEAFDDLAALLVADPIHEVEREAGWPHVAPQED